MSSIASAVELAPVPAIDRDAPAGLLDRRLDQQAVLVEIDGRRFAGRADDDDAGRAVGDVEVDQLAERGEIERAALAHRRRDRDETTGQHGGKHREKSAILPHSTAAGPSRFRRRRQRAVERRAATAAPRPTAARRCTTAPRSGAETWPCSNATTVSRRRREPQQLAGLEQEVRIRRPAVRLVAAGEGLVEQHAVVRRARRAGMGTAADAGNW